ITLPGRTGWGGLERRRVLNLGRLQGAQELEKSVFLARLEPFKFLGDMPGLAAVAEDSVQKRYGSAIVHEARVQADTPERGRTDFIAGVVEFGDREVFPGGLVHPLAIVLQHGHHDAVAGADIVEKEVAVGMKLLFSKSGRDSESAAVDFCSGSRSRERLDVTNIAADFVE